MSHSHNQTVEQFPLKSICLMCYNNRPKLDWPIRDFTYAELHAATQGFSIKNFLSEGGFGSVYKGEILGQKIAVKQCIHANHKQEKEFKSEVDALTKARHENVVMFLGSCSEGNNRFLVYEFVCNGSLDQHLSQYSRKPLCWQDRVKVANGAAKGLLYLHQNNIIHRDIKPNNILLTHDCEVLLGDFGLAKIVSEEFSCSIECPGNLAYWAPEYAAFGKVSNKTDVYSFGVVLVELITGMKTTDKRLGGKNLVGWARPLLRQGNCQKLVDGRIMDSHDCHQLFWLSRLAGNCLNKDPQKRLDMNTVVKALTHIEEGCSGCIVGKDSIAMSSYSKSKDDMQDSTEADDESGNIGSSSITANCKNLKL
ncbi:proline-rich receptor-like protein kinase PERK8 [Vicia villosa]|uniref:proline-rich receptor-like protein kinase PERK8 n=1 Tax=Vicia villosa TaxID=3911 RepID=UPI00273CDCA4|nr:proline-rich receptor-like protein kinase PERK8 [Vicia villosa]